MGCVRLCRAHGRLLAGTSAACMAASGAAYERARRLAGCLRCLPLQLCAINFHALAAPLSLCAAPGRMR